MNYWNIYVLRPNNIYIIPSRVYASIILRLGWTPWHHNSMRYQASLSGGLEVCLSFLSFIASTVNPYRNLNRKLKTITSKFIQTTDGYSFKVSRCIGAFSSKSLHTSRNFLGSSVMTPSTSFFILHFIQPSSLTVHRKRARLCFLQSRINLLPIGPIMTLWSMLNETFGTLRNCLAYATLNPIWVIEKSGRYCAQSGRYLAWGK